MMSPLLVPGRNCWTADAVVERAGALIDARAYYRAFYRAARQARRFILLAGWRFSSGVRLLRGPDADAEGEPEDVAFLPFLHRLLADNPELRIFILAWDFSFNYSLEWELFQNVKFEAGAAGRLRFLFDAEHAVGASHHQKWAVIDGQLAFVGGLDFCCDDWDDRHHLAQHPDRHDCGKEPHHPYHDLMAYLTGPAVQELTAYFRARWRAAGGGELSLPEPPDGPPPRVRSAVVLPGDRVAFSRTEAPTLNNPIAVQEVRQLYLDAIAAAEELIYLENQYFSSQAVFEALLARLKATGRPPLDVVMVLPQQLPSWVEAAAMGPPRLWMLEQLREAARTHGHRLGLYASVACEDDGREEPVLIHSKLLVVDDRFLTVGSANTSNRSMGLDTELNVSWEVRPGETRRERSIRRLRVSLLAEHCGLLGRAEARPGLRRKRGLVDYLDRLASEQRGRLRFLSREAFTADRAWLQLLERWGLAFDPGRAVLEETLHEALAANGAVGLARGPVGRPEPRAGTK